MARFKDRIAGATELLPGLKRFESDPDTVVAGLPRGGVITASVIAQGLKLPLGFLIVKKIGAAGDPELAIGAVSEDGTVLYDEALSSRTDIKYKESESQLKLDEARARGKLYRGSSVIERFDGKAVILVDDGIATGTTMLTAVAAARKLGAAKVIVAVPVAGSDSADKIKSEVDEFICVDTDPMLASVGEFYDDFPQVEDSEVLKILQNAKNNFSNK